MVNVDNLEHVTKFLTYISANASIQYRNYLYRLDPYKYLDQAVKYSLKNHEEVTGKLILISIDPVDESTGYCLMEVKNELFNVIIYEPKETFTHWEHDKSIVLHEHVGILRVDDKGIPKFYLRYFSDDFDESNVEFTKYIFDTIDMIASYDDVTEDYPSADPDLELR